MMNLHSFTHVLLYSGRSHNLAFDTFRCRAAAAAVAAYSNWTVVVVVAGDVDVDGVA